jgi:D-mannonate dehydratase
MTGDLPAVIPQFGEQGKIVFVHFRDVCGEPARFVETFRRPPGEGVPLRVTDSLPQPRSKTGECTGA